MPALEAGIHANATRPVVVWMAGSKAIFDRRLVFDAKAELWLWPAMTTP